jgi:tRNA(fMet)-specific endonuclease VapC
MYILDTDHLSLIQRNGQEGKRILARLSSIEYSMIAVTIITDEEQVRGRLNLVSQAKTLDDRVRAYRGVQQISMDYRFITVVPFDNAAALEDQSLFPLGKNGSKAYWQEYKTYGSDDNP